MIGGTANLHYVYAFSSVAAASALIDVPWEVLICNKNPDNTLVCSAMGQSVFHSDDSRRSYVAAWGSELWRGSDDHSDTCSSKRSSEIEGLVMGGY